MELASAGIHLREDASDGVFRAVGFYNNRVIRIKVSENRSGSESGLERVERCLAAVGPYEPGVLARKIVERSTDLRIIIDETSIKISKSEEGLDFLDVRRLRPSENNVNLGRIHLDSLRRYDIAEVLDGIAVKVGFLRVRVKICLPESLENFADMDLMVLEVLGEDENIVK